MGEEKKYTGDRFEKANLLRKTKTHCKYDHELKGDNLLILKNGVRHCVACQRLRDARRKAARAAARAAKREGKNAPKPARRRSATSLAGVIDASFANRSSVKIIPFGQAELSHEDWLQLHGMKKFIRKPQKENPR